MGCFRRTHCLPAGPVLGLQGTQTSPSPPPCCPAGKQKGPGCSLHPGKPPLDGRGNPGSQRRSDLPRARKDPRQGPWALRPPATPWAPQRAEHPHMLGPSHAHRTLLRTPQVGISFPTPGRRSSEWAEAGARLESSHRERQRQDRPPGALTVRHQPASLRSQSLNHVRLCELLDGSLPGSSVHGIFQARILELAAISSCRDIPDPVMEPISPVSPLADGFFTC